ncbi:MAG: hypothetical protein KAI72_01575 [Candidatus Pacebacteria bacterium]|nr:hypothetical protein [Candidatus Paceibacterota bacterium]
MPTERKKEQKKSGEIREKMKKVTAKVERAEAWPEPPADNNKKSDDS